MTNIKPYIYDRYQQLVSHLYIKKEIKVYPKFAHTSGKNFFGRIRKNITTGMIIDIRINSAEFQRIFNTEGEEALKWKLDETICHELAHILYWNHKQEHSLETLRLLEITKGLPVTPIERTPIAVAAHTITLGPITKLSDICNNSTKARAALRKAGIEKPGARWEWEGGIPIEVQKIVGLL